MRWTLDWCNFSIVCIGVPSPLPSYILIIDDSKSVLKIERGKSISDKLESIETKIETYTASKVLPSLLPWIQEQALGK